MDESEQTFFQKHKTKIIVGGTIVGLTATHQLWWPKLRELFSSISSSSGGGYNYHFLNPAVPLGSLKHKSASVLPVVEINGIQYCILMPEAGGQDKGKLDACGGKADPGEKPEHTAARECWEEMIAQKTLGWSLEDMQKHIQDNTVGINIQLDTARPGNNNHTVVYSVNFTADQIQQLARTFNDARNQATKWEHKEKTGIVLVEVKKIANAIKTNGRYGGTFTVQVDGQVYTKHGIGHAKKYDLRKLLVFEFNNGFKGKTKNKKTTLAKLGLTENDIKHQRIDIFEWDTRK